MLTVCADCGTPYPTDATATRRAACPTCRPVEAPRPERGTRHARGYDAAWSRLSARARRAQPFCEDCGREDDLTTDHSPAAWQRRERGLPIRLEDVAVVCRACNSARGAARGESVSWHGGQGRPAVALEDLDGLDLDTEGCDGKCERQCPEHRAER